MVKEDLLITVQIPALAIEREFRIADSFTVKESIDAILTLLAQEHPQLAPAQDCDLYLPHAGFLQKEALLKDVVAHPSERMYLL